jgi:RNA polymerase sigma-70 factor, ECF subfamily
MAGTAPEEPAGSPGGGVGGASAGGREQLLLAAAQAGDNDAFGRLVAPHRAALLAHCYRMLGSPHDAEDAVQDALLRAWRAFGRFEGRASLRSWLYTIATNVCLRMSERRGRRVLPVAFGPATAPGSPPLGPLPETTWIEPFPDVALPAADAFASPAARYDQRESVELAFVAALALLPARQRAVLILRDVLAFSGEETAAALNTTTASVSSALQRARGALERRLPRPSQQATLRSIGDPSVRATVATFVEAWQRNDVDAVVALLAADVTLAMPPRPTWFRGRDAVAAFLRARPLSAGPRWQAVPVGANGQLATANYLWDAATAMFEAHSVNVLSFGGTEIVDITCFMAPAAFARFGLPRSLAPSAEAVRGAGQVGTRRASTSISIFMRGSARPHTSMVAAGRTEPKYRRSTGQQASNSARSVSRYRTRTTSAKA